VGEGRVSFQKDMLGKPIEFAAGKWELTREGWLASRGTVEQLTELVE